MSTDDDIDDAIKVALVQASTGQVDRSTVDRALEILGMEVGGLRARCAELERWKADANHVIDAVQRAYKIAGDSAVIGDDIDDTVARMRAQLDELTREVERLTRDNREYRAAIDQNHRVFEETIRERNKVMHERNAAIRERDEALAAREQEREKCHEHMLACRGLDREWSDICKDCGGLGVKLYANTTTWAGGIGGQAMTHDVCDRCWGSGDKSRPGVNLRVRRGEMRKLTAERDATLATIERVRAVLTSDGCECRSADCAVCGGLAAIDGGEG